VVGGGGEGVINTVASKSGGAAGLLRVGVWLGGTKVGVAVDEIKVEVGTNSVVAKGVGAAHAVIIRHDTAHNA